MSGYRFKAHDREGKKFTGVMQAATREDAERSLARQGLIPDLVREEPLDKSFRLRNKPSHLALTQFFRQFATLQDAAVPLLLSLEILQGLTSDRVLRDALVRVASDVESGSTLTDAMRRHPKVFSNIAVSVIGAGEEGGHLDHALESIADYEERAQEVRERVRSAMIYPMVILVVAAVAVLALLTLVVPTFEGIFRASGQELPFPTQVLVTASEFSMAYWPFGLAAALFMVLVARALYGTAAFRRLAHRVVLRIPILGRLTRKLAVARVSRTLGSLLTSGVSILDALAAGARTSGNMVVETAIMETRESVAAGREISVALSHHPVLPSMVYEMVGVGEQTGRLDEMFNKVAAFFEREVDLEIEGLLKALEPALVVLVGLALGGIVTAMYLPIFDAIGAVDPVGF